MNSLWKKLTLSEKVISLTNIFLAIGTFVLAIVAFLTLIASIKATDQTLSLYKHQFDLAHKGEARLCQPHFGNNFGLKDSIDSTKKRIIDVASYIAIVGNETIFLESAIGRFYPFAPPFANSLAVLEKEANSDTIIHTYRSKNDPPYWLKLWTNSLKDSAEMKNCKSGNSLLFIELFYTNWTTGQRFKYVSSYTLRPYKSIEQPTLNWDNNIPLGFKNPDTLSGRISGNYSGETNSSNFLIIPEFIEALAAIGMLLIGIVTLRQQMKIKTLTDVVEELTNQNKELANQTKELKKHSEIHSKRYYLENITALREISPYFVKRQFKNTLIGTYELDLANEGDQSYNIRPILPSSANFTVHSRGDVTEVPAGSGITLVISMQYDEKEHGINFNFTLSFEDGNGNDITQQILCKNNKFKIGSPIGVIE